jgi:Ca2+-binding RTX toxin-like protein
VTRAGDTTATSTVAWSLASSGSAPADDLDFSGGTLPAGTLTFSPGQTSQIVSIQVAGDTEVEADEAFTVSLATPTGAELDSAASAAAGIIRNDDTPPTPLPVLRISASEADRPEGNAGSTPFSFTVSRSGDTTGVSRATWTVGRSEAPTVNAADFAGSGFARGQVRFQAGETEQTIRVSVQGDLDEEANERFSVTLSAPSGANLARAAATGKIRNDDLIGTARADRLRGSDAPEFIDGLAGQDSLTGGRGPDLFGFGFGDSSLRTPDLITDFRFGDDRIAIFRSNSDTPATPDRFSRAANNRTAATLTDLAAAVFADADGQRRGDQPLGATAAAFVVSTNRAIAGAYLLINDNRATATLSSDLMVNITGATGPLPAPGANPVGALFA